MLLEFVRASKGQMGSSLMTTGSFQEVVFHTETQEGYLCFFVLFSRGSQELRKGIA